MLSNNNAGTSNYKRSFDKELPMIPKDLKVFSRASRNSMILMMDYDRQRIDALEVELKEVKKKLTFTSNANDQLSEEIQEIKQELASLKSRKITDEKFLNALDKVEEIANQPIQLNIEQLGILRRIRNNLVVFMKPFQLGDNDRLNRVETQVEVQKNQTQVIADLLRLNVRRNAEADGAIIAPLPDQEIELVNDESRSSPLQSAFAKFGKFFKRKKRSDQTPTISSWEAGRQSANYLASASTPVLSSFSLNAGRSVTLSAVPSSQLMPISERLVSGQVQPIRRRRNTAQTISALDYSPQAPISHLLYQTSAVSPACLIPYNETNLAWVQEHGLNFQIISTPHALTHLSAVELTQNNYYCCNGVWQQNPYLHSAYLEPSVYSQDSKASSSTQPFYYDCEKVRMNGHISSISRDSRRRHVQVMQMPQSYYTEQQVQYSPVRTYDFSI